MLFYERILAVSCDKLDQSEPVFPTEIMKAVTEVIANIAFKESFTYICGSAWRCKAFFESG